MKFLVREITVFNVFEAETSMRLPYYTEFYLFICLQASQLAQAVSMGLSNSLSSLFNRGLGSQKF